MRWKSWLFLFVLALLGGGVLWLYGIFTLDISAVTDIKKEKTGVNEPLELAGEDGPLITFIDPSKGAKNPSVTIVEFGDHACPFCKAAEKSIDRLIEEMPGKIRLVWKDRPSPLHSGADLAAEAAQCAKDQGRFWEYHAKLMENQGVYNQTGLSLLANEMSLDVSLFTKCVARREKKYVIERSVDEADRLGVDGTPYFFINGERYSGQLTYEELKEIVTR